MNSSIVITGEGIVSAIGLDKKSVLRSLQEGKTGIGLMHYLDSVHKELPVGEVHLSNEEMKERVENRARLWLDHGDMFGEGGELFERINIACPRSILEQAMNQLAEAFK